MEKKTVEIESRVIKVVAVMLGWSKADVSKESNLVNDLGADSLDIVEIIFKLEQEFSVSIPDDVVEKIETVQDVINFLEDKINH